MSRCTNGKTNSWQFENFICLLNHILDVGKALVSHCEAAVAPPRFARRFVEENGSAAMLAAKRLAGVAPKVNLREHGACMPPPSVNKVAHSGYETQRRHHQ